MPDKLNRLYLATAISFKQQRTSQYNFFVPDVKGNVSSFSTISGEFFQIAYPNGKSDFIQLEDGIKDEDSGTPTISKLLADINEKANGNFEYRDLDHQLTVDDVQSYLKQRSFNLEGLSADFMDLETDRQIAQLSQITNADARLLKGGHSGA